MLIGPQEQQDSNQYIDWYTVALLYFLFALTKMTPPKEVKTTPSQNPRVNNAITKTRPQIKDTNPTNIKNLFSFFSLI
jgi:hypothetical protein